jgi:hypothetical protein
VEGAEERGRLTNLTRLTVDTSWYARYRSADSPDFGATFPQLVEIRDRPTIPTRSRRKAGLQGVALFPEPTRFLRDDLALCSGIRPCSTEQAGAVAAATGLVQSGLFAGQPRRFFDAVTALATTADAAERSV